jgi:very-short-patch-repair endonuclease
MPKKLTTNEFIKRSNEVHDNLYDYTLTEYINSHTKVKIKCNKGHIFEQKACDHLNGRGCRYCSELIIGDRSRYSLEHVKQLLFSKYSNKYQFNFDNYVNLETKIECICSLHGTKKIRVSSLIKGFECTYCKGTKPNIIDLTYFINKSVRVHGKYYDYSNSVVVNSTSKVDIICPKHGTFKQSANAHMRGQGCPICKLSKGELKVRKFLELKKIKYKYQHKFENFKRYSFDFYLPEFNICIEYDGEFHFNKYKISGGVGGLLKTQKRDLLKNNYCDSNGINLIRIPYWEFESVEHILSNRINI